MDTSILALHLLPLAPLVLGLSLAACGGSVDVTGTGGQGGGGDECTLDVPPPGWNFTFHIHNGSTSPRSLSLGCGEYIPITLETPSGAVVMGKGGDMECDADGSCASAYKGDVITWCSDCGPGVSRDLSPGATFDIVWDHRGYVESIAPETCSGVPGGAPCTLTVPVPPTTMQNGTLTVCTNPNNFSYCWGSTVDVSFTVDTTLAEATIDLM